MTSFSIITCTWQAATVLERTLASVAAQDYTGVEHLIIDGASTDGTLQLAHRYAEDVKGCGRHRVRVVSESDGGLYDAMNKGLRLATGQYVLFLNAGDTLHAPDTLSRVAAAARQGDVLPGVVYGDTDIVDENGRFQRHRRLSPPERLTWRSFRSGMLVCHQAFYALTAIARATPYNLGYRYSADIDWCIRVMREAERQRRPLRRVSAVVADFLDGGMTTQNHRKSLRERFRVMRSHYGLASTLAMHLWFVLRGVAKK